MFLKRLYCDGEDSDVILTAGMNATTLSVISSSVHTVQYLIWHLSYKQNVVVFLCYFDLFIYLYILPSEGNKMANIQ